MTTQQTINKIETMAEANIRVKMLDFLELLEKKTEQKWFYLGKGGSFKLPVDGTSHTGFCLFDADPKSIFSEYIDIYMAREDKYRQSGKIEYLHYFYPADSPVVAANSDVLMGTNWEVKKKIKL